MFNPGQIKIIDLTVNELVKPSGLLKHTGTSMFLFEPIQKYWCPFRMPERVTPDIWMGITFLKMKLPKYSNLSHNLTRINLTDLLEDIKHYTDVC